MFDINFVKKTALIKNDIVTQQYSGDIFKEFEALRAEKPYVYQVETTNVCNLKCVMCPRTELMERKQGYMSISEFQQIINALEPHNETKFQEWKTYAEQEFLSKTLTYEEDFFYFMVCAQTLVLHGFGEPVLDKTLGQKIAYATQKGVPTYFSMNPINIKLDKMKELAESGLDYLKFSLEGLDNETQLMYRGVVDKTFNETLKKIFDTIQLFKEGNYKTKVILTRLSFKEDPVGDKEYLDFWKDYPVMAYIKNQHNRWLYKEDEVLDNTAEYMQRYCEFPWTSVSILYDGTIVPCPLDYDGEMSMGNVKENTLEEVWNSKKYEDFRKMHINGNFPADHFCKLKCDFNKLYEFTEQH